MASSTVGAGLAWAALGGAVFLGVLQGLTEFLPVSSSGHLVLFQQFFSIAGDEVLFDLVLHLGTLVPVLWFYRADLAEIARDLVAGQGPFLSRRGVRLAGLLVVATVPTGLIGVLFKDMFEALFATPAALVITFALTGCILFATRFARDGRLDVHGMHAGHALILGVAQGLAITPGISRSGTTIAVALMLGLDRGLAARFSFLMSIPAILGAVVLKGREADLAQLDVPALALGGVAALVTGYFALVFLVRIVKRGGLSAFAWYCWTMAVVAGVIALFAGA